VWRRSCCPRPRDGSRGGIDTSFGAHDHGHHNDVFVDDHRHDDDHNNHHDNVDHDNRHKYNDGEPYHPNDNHRRHYVAAVRREAGALGQEASLEEAPAAAADETTT
jgi:hypothetical protein